MICVNMIAWERRRRNSPQKPRCDRIVWSEAIRLGASLEARWTPTPPSLESISDLLRTLLNSYLPRCLRSCAKSRGSGSATSPILPHNRTAVVVSTRNDSRDENRLVLEAQPLRCRSNRLRRYRHGETRPKGEDRRRSAIAVGWHLGTVACSSASPPPKPIPLCHPISATALVPFNDGAFLACVCGGLYSYSTIQVSWQRS